MIDTHAHLAFADFDRDREVVIERCKKELWGVVASGARLDENLKVLALSKEHQGFVHATLGFHPTEKGDFEKVIELIRKNKEGVVGVGEVGLDYHWVKDAKEREKQKDVFERFIGLAQELKKPLVIHSWDAEKECFDMVRKSDAMAVFHCFSGSNELAKEIAAQGHHVSISTQICFSKNHRKIAKDVPIDKMLLETDSPFLSPNREQDKRNYPWNIKISAEKIAKVKGMEVQSVLEECASNARKVFGI